MLVEEVEAPFQSTECTARTEKGAAKEVVLSEVSNYGLLKAALDNLCRIVALPGEERREMSCFNRFDIKD